MNARIVRCIALGVSISCGGGGDSSGANGPPVPPPPPPPPPSGNAVNVADNLFDPSARTITGNTAVIWTWVGSAPHNVTFEDGVNSSSTQATGTHQRAFGAAGTFRYRCTIHSSNFTSGMVGSVVVQ